ncbi:MAG: pullulanase-type alpha-1,6-glucosidase [Nocardioides sp.]
MSRHSRASMAAASLLLGALVAAPLAVAPATPAVAATAAAPSSVTLVGSLQSELGCADDWQPSCEATHLTAVPGGTAWQATFTVPAGDYAYKVAIDNSWAESWGGGASGTADIPLHLEHSARLAFSYDAASHAVAVAPADQPSARPTAADRAMAGDSLRQPGGDRRFYFVMADRFANGDTSNDTGGIAGGRLDNGFDPTDKGFYHGGDIAGVTQKLDYIQGLGTDAIWLTPSFVNKPVQGTGADASAGYHGYWVTDFTHIDPHFGTNAELKDLIAKAHARGIKVYFDIITNHTADVIDYAQKQYSYVDKATAPYKDADGKPFDDRDYAGTDTFPKLDPATSFPYTPVFRTEADRTAKTPAFLNDVTNYHNRGDSTFAGESATYGDFVGLDDLFTEKPEVVKGMTDVYKTWVDFGIDGFRIDTVKHVNLEFWQKFAPAIKAEAQRVGKPDFFSFGEVYDADPKFMSTYSTKGDLDATLDFGFQQAGVGFAEGKATTGLRDLYAGDDWYTDRDSNAYALPTFLGNHDMGRVGHFLAASASGDELLKRDELAHQLMFLTRGQPVVYYGDEQGFTGDGGDKDARQDMFASKVADYNDDHLIGTDKTTATDSYDTKAPLYQEIAGLNRLRAAYPALSTGAQLHRYASSKAGIYAFSRISPTEKREYVVALNNATTAKTATFPTLSTHGTFAPIYPSTSGARLTSNDEGRLTVTVPPLSALVLRATAPVPHRSQAPAVFFRSPSAGSPVGGRQEIGVSVPDGGYNEVTLAYRPVGTAAWHPIGTDDNAPYRVFQDLSGFAKGSLLEYRAVLKDSSDNYSVASTYATVGDPAPAAPSGTGGTGGPVTQPAAVSMPGSHNSEIGCSGDWQPDCDQAQLALDPKDDVWKGTVDVPAGDYEYKAAIDKSWTENYGVGGVAGAGNIGLKAPGGPVSFYYDHATHWITTDAQGPIVTAAGSFQSELGCPGDWAPDCMRSWLEDPDGDGTYTFSTTSIPAGSYQVKATHGLSWAENYGAGGARDGANIDFDVPADGVEVDFSYDVASHVLTVKTRAPGATPDLTKRKAQWVRRGLVAWKPQSPEDPATKHYRLHWSAAGGLAADDEAVTGGDSVPLTYDPAGLPAEVLADFPQLKGYQAFRLSAADQKRVPEILRGQLAVASYDDLNHLVDATGVQIPGVLDDVFGTRAQDRVLGLSWAGTTPRFGLWAPTAQDVDLLVQPAGGTEQRVQMARQDDGSWTTTGRPSWRGATYRYDVKVYAPSVGAVVRNQVTDPYSVALTADSKRSVVADLADPALASAGWQADARPTVAQPEDRNIYELHIRDFSIGDTTVPKAERGTYLAFTKHRSAGMTALRDLAKAGLNTVHLLPSFDIATIEEHRDQQATPQCDLASYAPDSSEQQKCVTAVAAKDGFNWGYDPLHYTTPEGSYATDADGPARTEQYRAMVQGLHRTGLQVVMDVVYNHTAASGQDAGSVLDEVVPGYYQRLSATGAQETSTCCANTASEHLMMQKLMTDSVLTWAKEYHVDGFRFDLMGHHSKANMLHLRAALDRLTVAKDGVDGKGIYLYGEGWNFGEVADNARFVQATQANMAGTGIGTFNDRLRDAVRGGSPFDDDPRKQGFGDGLFTDPNGDAVNGTADQQKAALLHDEDLVKLGLAGNLAAFRFTDSTGQPVTGHDVDYNGQPAGYTADPSEDVNYVDAHDNETLFDVLQEKLPQDTSMADRVRMNTVALSTTALSQGVVFWHAGTDILRSKSLDRNSYDSGDWFNRVDWTRHDSTFGSGLPPAADNGAKWDYMRPLLADPALKPGQAAMDEAHARALDLLRIRMSTPLFRLGSATEIQDKVSFPAADPGVVAMKIDDTVGVDRDPALSGVLVVFNASPSATTVPGVGSGWTLHTVQADGSDPVVKTSSAGGDAVTVPARTTAVFVRRTAG